LRIYSRRSPTASTSAGHKRRLSHHHDLHHVATMAGRRTRQRSCKRRWAKWRRHRRRRRLQRRRCFLPSPSWRSETCTLSLTFERARARRPAAPCIFPDAMREHVELQLSKLQYNGRQDKLAHDSLLRKRESSASVARVPAASPPCTPPPGPVSLGRAHDRWPCTERAETSESHENVLPLSACPCAVRQKNKRCVRAPHAREACPHPHTHLSALRWCVVPPLPSTLMPSGVPVPQGQRLRKRVRFTRTDQEGTERSNNPGPCHATSRSTLPPRSCCRRLSCFTVALIDDPGARNSCPSTH
jgi:hypothetical protein